MLSSLKSEFFFAQQVPKNIYRLSRNIVHEFQACSGMLTKKGIGSCRHYDETERCNCQKMSSTSLLACKLDDIGNSIRRLQRILYIHIRLLLNKVAIINMANTFFHLLYLYCSILRYCWLHLFYCRYAVTR